MTTIAKTTFVLSFLLAFTFSVVYAAVEPAPYGTYGTLVLYGTDVNLPLDYLGSYEDDTYAQSLCDDPFKGVITDLSEAYGFPVSLVVADHRHQGFDALYDVIPDESVAEIFYTDGTSQKFICREKTNGINNGSRIQVNEINAELIYPSDWICMYTCNPEGWWDVTVTFWEPLY